MVNVLKYNEILRNSGWTKDQASGMIEVMSDMTEQNLVSKTDLQLESTNIRAEMRKQFDGLKHDMQVMDINFKNEINEVRTGLKNEIHEVRTELKNEIQMQSDKIVIRLGAVIVGVSTIISIFFGAIKT